MCGALAVRLADDEMLVLQTATSKGQYRTRNTEQEIQMSLA